MCTELGDVKMSDILVCFLGTMFELRMILYRLIVSLDLFITSLVLGFDYVQWFCFINKNPQIILLPVHMISDVLTPVLANSSTVG